MSLDIDITLTRDAFELIAGVSFDARTPTAVVGPNGAGKSSLLAAVAGLVPVSSGSITLDGRTLTGDGVVVPPAKRSMGVVFQDLRLFPTRSALDNVAFPLCARGVSKRNARTRAHEWLNKLGGEPVANVRADALSGGYAQRVALARALASEPSVLLLDEPLSSLDAGARVQTRRVIAEVLESFDGVAILVTHDPLEALSLCDRLVILEGGRVAQIGSREEVGLHPRTEFGAALLGLNLFQGSIDTDRASVRMDGATIAVGPTDLPAGADVFASIHPRSIVLSSDRPSGSARNVISGAVRTIDEHDGRARLELDSNPRLIVEVTSASVAGLGLAPGATVWASFKATDVRVYER